MPSRKSALAALSRLLAELYREVRRCRRVVDQAGLRAEQIDFQDNALDNWHAILLEADRRLRLEALLEVVCEDYPEQRAEIEAAHDRVRSTGELSAAGGVGRSSAVPHQLPAPVGDFTGRE